MHVEPARENVTAETTEKVTCLSVKGCKMTLGMYVANDLGSLTTHCLSFHFLVNFAGGV